MKRALGLASLALALLGTTFTSQDEEEGPRAPAVGEAAPAFRLNDHLGRAVAIGGESETWTVLAFFPKAATPG